MFGTNFFHTESAKANNGSLQTGTNKNIHVYMNTFCINKKSILGNLIETFASKSVELGIIVNLM